ncbi:MAG: DUF484 family protein [Alphaproteobacteria bacterium]|nr:DUF484 family protein [Alphaproteobacteria bacterium]
MTLESKSAKPAQSVARAAAAHVAAYLRANPGFLAAHPEILAGQRPPRRALGDGVADFQEFLIERLREDVRRLTDAKRALVEERREARALAARMQKAALALIATADLTALAEAVTVDLAVLLGVDVAALGVETTVGISGRDPVSGVRCLPAGTVDEVLGEGCDVRVIPDGAVDSRAFGAGAGLVRSAVLVRVGGRRDLPPALLGVGSRHGGRFHGGACGETMRFLAEVLEHCLRTRLGLPV